MGEEIKDGGPAFPVVGMGAIGSQNYMQIFSSGLTKREVFAGMALMGLLNNAESRIFPMKHQEDLSNAEILAENAYYMADAMLRHTEKTNGRG